MVREPFECCGNMVPGDASFCPQCRQAARSKNAWYTKYAPHIVGAFYGAMALSAAALLVVPGVAASEGILITFPADVWPAWPIVGAILGAVVCVRARRADEAGRQVTYRGPALTKEGPRGALERQPPPDTWWRDFINRNHRGL